MSDMDRGENGVVSKYSTSGLRHGTRYIVTSADAKARESADLFKPKLNDPPGRDAVDAPLAQLRTATLRGLTVYPALPSRCIPIHVVRYFFSKSDRNAS